MRGKKWNKRHDLFEKGFCPEGTNEGTGLILVGMAGKYAHLHNTEPAFEGAVWNDDLSVFMMPDDFDLPCKYIGRIYPIFVEYDMFYKEDYDGHLYLKKDALDFLEELVEGYRDKKSMSLNMGFIATLETIRVRKRG